MGNAGVLKPVLLPSGEEPGTVIFRSYFEPGSSSAWRKGPARTAYKYVCAVVVLLRRPVRMEFCIVEAGRTLRRVAAFDVTPADDPDHWVMPSALAELEEARERAAAK